MEKYRDTQCFSESQTRKKHMKIISSSTPTHPASQENSRRLHGAALISVISALMLTLLLEALDQLNARSLW